MTDDAIRTLVRQTARWAVAAEQDASPLIANLHANYARATLDALRQIATDSAIRSAASIDVLDFERRVTAVQDGAARKLAAACPSGVPRGPLAVAAGEGLGRVGQLEPLAGWWAALSPFGKSVVVLGIIGSAASILNLAVSLRERRA